MTRVKSNVDVDGPQSQRLLCTNPVDLGEEKKERERNNLLERSPINNVHHGLTAYVFMTFP